MCRHDRKLLDLQRQREKLNDATMQALCVLPLAHVSAQGPRAKEPQSDVLPIKHVLPHASQAAMHAAAHVAAQAEAQVAADAQMALKAEAQVVVHPKNHVENRTGQDETRGTVPETTGETSHGQVSAEGAGTRSNVEPGPISERKPGPNFGTISELKDETSDEPQIGSTARAISELSADTMPATDAQMVWESRSGPKAEELKSVTISVTKSKTNIETNAEITAAVPAPKSDLTFTLEHESSAEMPEPRFTANANHALNTEARFASKHDRIPKRCLN